MGTNEGERWWADENGPVRCGTFAPPESVSTAIRERMNADRRAAEAGWRERLIAAWNEANPVGSPVVVLRDNGEAHRGTVKYPAQVDRADQCVAWVTGIAGAYALERIVPDTAAAMLAGERRGAEAMRKRAENIVRGTAAYIYCEEPDNKEEADRWRRMADRVAALPLPGAPAGEEKK